MCKRFGMVVFLVAMAAGCTVKDGLSVLVTQEPPGANCPAGGARVQVGDGAPTYVCNGVAGAPGLSAAISTEPPGLNCATGGVKIQVGDGVSTYVCNGATGANGQSVAATIEPPGPNCAAGGVRLQVGTMDPVYACNGAGGSSCTIVTGNYGTSLVCTDGTATVLIQTYSIGGTVSGLLGDGIWLYMWEPAGARNQFVAADGAYEFYGLSDGDWWELGWGSPATMTCTASTDYGLISRQSVSSADITCACAQGRGNCDGDPSNACETTLASDHGNCGGCGISCQALESCLSGVCSRPSYAVNAGPAWSDDPPVYSCLEACALVLGGTASGWSCSTEPNAVNHLAWYSAYGKDDHCGPLGTPLPEDQNLGGTYFGGGYSAYVNDHCGPASINYCFPAGL